MIWLKIDWDHPKWSTNRYKEANLQRRVFSPTPNPGGSAFLISSIGIIALGTTPVNRKTSTKQIFYFALLWFYKVQLDKMNSKYQRQQLLQCAGLKPIALPHLQFSSVVQLHYSILQGNLGWKGYCSRTTLMNLY